jgi:hypothetical protein
VEDSGLRHLIGHAGRVLNRPNYVSHGHNPRCSPRFLSVRVVECRGASWDAPRSGVRDRWRRATRAGHVLEDGQDSGLFPFDRRADAEGLTNRAMVASSVAGCHGRTTVTRGSLRRTPPDKGLLIMP